MPKTNLPILEQRRIEANIIKPIYAEMKRRLGTEQAQEIIGQAVIQDAVAQGQAYAEAQQQTPTLQSFLDLLPQWTAGGALEIDILEQTDDKLSFNVTRCRYSEMYREMGLGEVGHLLSCNRDGSFCDGYQPRMKLVREQTVMSGASHCDFRYHMQPED